jgi:NAD(P)H-nitrite reductase large subunit
MEIVIIGNGPAAISALEAISTHKAVSGTDELKITIISEERSAAYAPMFLCDHLAGELGEKEILLGENHGLSPERLIGEKVVEVEESENRVILESGKKITYDRLLIASGASPLTPPIKGIDKEGVYFFNRLGDVKRLLQKLSTARDIIIIGAGAIGLEAAIAFNNKMGKNVLIVEQLCQCLPQMLDEDQAGFVEMALHNSGIRFMLEGCVFEISGDKRATGVVVGDKEITGDLVLITCGITPNVHFLTSSNVRVNQGILVNEKMQTNIPNIYAAGDVAESIDPYGGSELVFNWYNAIDQGWTAGCNLIGIEHTYKASPSLAVLKGTESPVISIGRTYGENGYVTLSYKNAAKGISEKIFIKDNHIDCYQAIGISDKIGLMYSYIKERKDISNIKDMLCDNYSSVSLVA